MFDTFQFKLICDEDTAAAVRPLGDGNTGITGLLVTTGLFGITGLLVTTGLFGITGLLVTTGLFGITGLEITGLLVTGCVSVDVSAEVVDVTEFVKEPSWANAPEVNTLEEDNKRIAKNTATIIFFVLLSIFFP